MPPSGLWFIRAVMQEGLEDVVVVLVTAPEAEAPRIARALVERRLAACVNLVSGVRSVYRWQGAIEDGVETLMLLKTTRTGFEALRAGVRELHPYSVPEILALPVGAGDPPYLRWVAEGVGA